MMKAIKAKIHWFLHDEQVNEVLVSVGLVLCTAGWIFLVYQVIAVLMRGQ